MRTLILLALLAATAAARAEPAAETPILLRPTRVFDGTTMHAGWRVLVKGDRIVAAGADIAAAGAREIDLPDTTLLPGLIEGHSHLFLHSYNETSWDDQVLHESIALRTALVAKSVPPKAIAIVGAGATSPLVPTTKGAKEPQNRRAEVTLIP